MYQKPGKTTSPPSQEYDKHLELLEPEVTSAAQQHLQAYALDYVERYQEDVLQLERERTCLVATVVQAWRQEHYTHVVRLVEGLAYLAGRLGQNEEGERLLFWGIQASRHLQDQRHLASFLNRLGGLLCARGKYKQAQQVWKESLEVANALGYPAYLWEPFSSVVHIADLLGGYTAAQRFAETLLFAQRVDGPNSVVVAMFIRGFYARLMGDVDRAYNDLSSCLHSLSSQNPTAPSSAYEHFFTLEVQAELARVQGKYIRAQAYAEAAISLAQAFCDPYAVVALLFDQALFAYQQGMFNDAYAAIVRLLEATKQVEAPYYSRNGQYLLHELAHISHEYRIIPSTSSLPSGGVLLSAFKQESVPSETEQHLVKASHLCSASLSKRELEVLQLVADGLSNREIAAQFVISLGTVKKHLEHISTKLDAYSRTHAVARARALLLLP